MCGICGYFNLDASPIRESGTIISMLKIQKHRGPDSTGIKCFSFRNYNSLEVGFRVSQSIPGDFEGVLGFNRLSILDLSVAGNQPMSDPEGKILLTLNGEIYNAFDFKHELETWGYHFKSKTDTEVVLALYLKYGLTGMLNRLNGMFAIVIVDLRQGKLFLARDKYGIKPLYYCLHDRLFAFSSELKSFGFLQGFEFRLSEDKVDEYLLFRGNLRGTLFRNIELLSPGTYLVVGGDGEINNHRYFSINDFQRQSHNEFDLQMHTQLFSEALGMGVKRQLLSDVKLGCQLSGGIDSSLITLFANAHHPVGKLETVSIVFRDSRFDEGKFIDEVVEELNLVSHKYFLESDYYLDNIVNATWHLEAPISHPNTIAILNLSQKAKEHVTVLLSGEGADELFGGYPRFFYLSHPFSARSVYRRSRDVIRGAISINEYLSHSKRVVRSNAYSNANLIKMIRPVFNNELAVSDRLCYYRNLTGTLFDKQVKYEFNTYLPDLLLRQDKMSMACSIENRVPFLDDEVIEQSFRIPEKHLIMRHIKAYSSPEKYLLKKVLADRFGPKFAFRRKMGFGIPIRDFLCHPAFQEFIRDQILPSLVNRGLFPLAIIKKWVKNIDSLSFMELELLWVVITFEIWASIYLDGNFKSHGLAT